ncbi:MAG: metallophosphoesterase [Ruminococcus sp.]|nr:metallophosphoesterase [Ruminococcus sp.]
MKRIIPTVLFSAGIFSVCTLTENKFMLRKRRENLGGELKIFHISDIHKKNNCIFNKKILKLAGEEMPDLIFITGDLVSRYETDFSETEKLLSLLGEIAPIYMCMGNHEQSLLPDKRREFMKMVNRTAARLLINERENVDVRGKKLCVCGVQQDYSTYKNDGGYGKLDGFTLKQMKALMGERPDRETLLLAHNPLFAETYAQWGADFTFSGHIHGGVVRLFGKGLLSPERRFFPKYSKGVYSVGRMKLLVSAGIGKLRLFNPPEVVVYNIP